MRAQIAQQVIGLAEYYDKTLSENQLSMFVEDLMDLDFDDLQVAIKKYRQDPSNVFFPLPAKLISLVKPHITEKDEAQEISAAIIAAISRCGYTNPERAQEEIGSLGWEVVGRMGGWKQLCEGCTLENQNTLRAQLRGIAETVSKRAKRGELDQRPELPFSSDIKKLMSDSFKPLD
jgi:hypothetical protein